MMDDEDSVVSIEDVIKSIDEEKAIVMGGIKNHDSCSFISGYMKRQALYTCKTCLDISTTKAAFCYPCLVNCHEGHDTVELYTKRRFRCDCGNAKFGQFQCTLWEEKDDENIENQYNDNFSNCYCICKRPYPDEDYEGNEEMIQCGLCEDWYHIEHLNLPNNVKAPEDYEEMTCFLCLQKYSFLYFYALEHEEEASCELSESIRRMLTSNPLLQNRQLETEHEAKRCKLASLSEDIGEKSEECHLSATIHRFGTKQSCDITVKDLDLSNASEPPSIFWSASWRERLCKCSKCQESLVS
ncbi:unnamed protein product [Dicrocoelium dendriticum]|nr:unnamed protein product [Dicrocoelium dendriticum]